MNEPNPIDLDQLKSARDRFESKVEERVPEECWPWTSGTFKGGYGRFTLVGKYYQAHRIAWALAHGSDPGDWYILHLCGTEHCVNPDHLTRGTQSLNMHHAKMHGGPELFGGEDHPESKLTKVQVREMRTRYAVEDVTQAELGEDYGVTDTTVSDIVRGELWSHA